jgi:hypothetical protein
MKNYDKMVEFYSLLVELVKYEPFQKGTARDLAKIHAEIKSAIRVKEFSIKRAKEFYDDLDVREDFLQLAFQDLAPHLRDPKAQAVIRELYDHTGSCGEDLYLHVKNVRLFDDSEPQGPAVLTVVVDSYEGFMGLIGKDPKKRPDYVHATMGEQVCV